MEKAENSIQSRKLGFANTIVYPYLKYQRSVQRKYLNKKQNISLGNIQTSEEPLVAPYIHINFKKLVVRI